MATYKDDLDIIKAAEKDDKNMTLNAMVELDNKGLLGRYGGEGGGSDLWPEVPFVLKAGDDTPTPYEDLPQWAKDLPGITVLDVFVPLEVLKNEMPQSQPATGDSLFIVVYYDGLPGLRLSSSNCLIFYDYVEIISSANYIYSNQAISELGNLFLNFITGEAFAVSGGK